MNDHVYKHIELTGSSTTSMEEAVRNAIRQAARSVRHIGWFQVVDTRGHVVDGEVGHWQVTLKVGFRIGDD